MIYPAELKPYILDTFIDVTGDIFPLVPPAANFLLVVELTWGLKLRGCG